MPSSSAYFLPPGGLCQCELQVEAATRSELGIKRGLQQRPAPAPRRRSYRATCECPAARLVLRHAAPKAAAVPLDVGRPAEQHRLAQEGRAAGSRPQRLRSSDGTASRNPGPGGCREMCQRRGAAGERREQAPFRRRVRPACRRAERRQPAMATLFSPGSSPAPPAAVTTNLPCRRESCQARSRRACSPL